MTESNVCRLVNCIQEGQQPGLRVEVWPPPDAQPVTLWVHSSCFEAQRDSSVSPDPLEERGRIAPKARCVFCGRALPIVGRHPYALQIGDASHPARYWAHAECIEGAITDLAPSAH
jgi:hypothetical protein